MYTIYALIDPRDTVRYVGVTEDVYARFSQHLQCSSNNLDKNEWIQELKDHQLMLLMRRLEIAQTLEEARDREQTWIHHYLSKGARLFNLSIAKLFTYEDFVTKIGKPAAKQKAPKVEIPSNRGDAAKRATRIIRRNPHIKPAQLAQKAQISETYARNLLADYHAQQNAVNA